MIRPMSHADTQAVLDIWLAASLQAHGFIPPAYWRDKLDDVRNHYLPLSQTILYVDDVNGRVLAFASCIDSFLAALFVAPAAQGQGIGRRLLELVTRMHPDVDVTVYAQNTKAVRFYMRNGFVAWQRRHEAATGCEELCMQYVACK